MKKDNNYRMVIQALALLTQLGLAVLANIAVGFFLGRLLDNVLHMDSFFSIIGIILGVLSGFYSVYRLVIKISSDENDDIS
ncbi:AtpZ/AtpI family protein [Halocella sp. SP3-1]|uniref:AtpZ/AtpI family protein n=1 Tax=Halocella sp. SP3-1 TaxID=2382161 RepID=UPI000F752CDC|nr:AtpZ/AtpI family protein [Halocella sp. SP3-1]AZO93939.1 AtpZ/AtpI family protein [Halocella sp. SP3-1]